MKTVHRTRIRGRVGAASISTIGTLVPLLLLLTSAGCTRESLRVALEAQRRADQVQQAVFERQHEALRMLLYRDLVRRLEETGAACGPPQRAVLNEVWNERDLLEFWNTQHERAVALRAAGVDAKLASDQSIATLLSQSLVRSVERLEQRFAAAVGSVVGERLVETSGGAKGDAQ